MYWKMSSDKDSDDGINHLLKLIPWTIQNVNKIWYLISGEFYIIE